MEENDRLLMDLAQRSGGLEPMLDAVFSFMKRKTDLYVEQGPGDRVGFPPGEAQKIVLKCFGKFASMGGPAPDKKALEAIGMRLQDGSSAHHRDQKQSQQSAHNPTPAQISGSAPAPAPPKSSAPTSAALSSPLTTANLPHYNGAALETYAWSQTLTDVTISLPLLSPCPAKSLSISIEKSRVSVHRRDASSSSCVLQGDLPHDIDASESLWNLDGSTVVAPPSHPARQPCIALTAILCDVVFTIDVFQVLHLEKRVQTWWECAIKGHPCIDTQRVDSSRHIRCDHSVALMPSCRPNLAILTIFSPPQFLRRRNAGS